MDIWYKCNREFVSLMNPFINFGTLGEEYCLTHPDGILPTHFYLKLEGLADYSETGPIARGWLNAERFELVDPAILTDNQIEVMETLYYSHFHSSCPQKWCTPLDLCASNGSHHSGSLAALAKKGLVNYKQRGGSVPPLDENGEKMWRGRGSKEYRLTTAGTAWMMQRHINRGRRCYDGAPIEDACI